MALLELPSVIVDAVFEDFLDAVAGSATAIHAEPYALSDGDSIDFVIDGWAPQTIAFNDVDFINIAEATAAEVVAVLNASLVGGRARVIAGAVELHTSTMGATGSIEINSQPAGVFDFPAGLRSGTNAALQTLVINRVPEAGEHEVPLDASIAFEMFRAGAAAPVISDLDVTINQAAVVIAGVAQLGWGLASSNPDASTLRVELTSPGLYTSDGDIVVEVAVASIGFSDAYTWMFHTFDLVRPHTLQAQARSKRVIRVTFSEAVQQLDPSGAADALNPAHYLIERVSVPAVDLIVTAVAPISSSIVDLEVDIEMTFGASYELTVIHVADIAGNAHVAAPNNVVSFSGFVPTFPLGRRFLLQDFVPRMNLGEDAQGDLRRFLAVLQEVTNVLLSSIDEWSEILDLDVAAEQYLDAMLADLGNPFGFDLSTIDKRRLLRILVRLYQLKGTRPGMIAAVQFFMGLTVDVETYVGTGWELGDDTWGGDELNEIEDGEPPAIIGPDGPGLYSFRIVSPVDLSETQRAQMRALAEYMKVSHEHYLGTLEPTEQSGFDHVELDFSELGEGIVPGNFIVH